MNNLSDPEFKREISYKNKPKLKVPRPKTRLPEEKEKNFNQELERLKNLFVDLYIESRAFSSDVSNKNVLYTVETPYEFKSWLSLAELQANFAHWSVNYAFDGKANNKIKKCGRNKYTIEFGDGAF